MHRTSLRRRAGAAMLQTVIGASCATIVLGASIQLTQTNGELASSAAAGDTTSRRTEHALDVFRDHIRSASFATFRKADGTDFADGAFDDGILGRRVVGFSNGMVLGSQWRLRWIAGPGGTVGDVVREQDGLTEVIARGVERFRVTRTGESFTVSVTASKALRGTESRTSRGSVTTRARNP